MIRCGAKAGKAIFAASEKAPITFAALLAQPKTCVECHVANCSEKRCWGQTCSPLLFVLSLLHNEGPRSYGCSFCLALSLSLSPPLSLSTPLSLSACLSLSCLSMCLSISLSLTLSVCLCQLVCLSLSLSVCLSLCVRVSVCLSVCLCMSLSVLFVYLFVCL